MSIRRRNARKPLLRIAGDSIFYNLLVMEACADGKSGKKGERSEDRVGDDNPACGERDGGKLPVPAVRHGRGWWSTCSPSDFTTIHSTPFVIVGVAVRPPWELGRVRKRKAEILFGQQSALILSKTHRFTVLRRLGTFLLPSECPTCRSTRKQSVETKPTGQASMRRTQPSVECTKVINTEWNAMGRGTHSGIESGRLS